MPQATVSQSVVPSRAIQLVCPCCDLLMQVGSNHDHSKHELICPRCKHQVQAAGNMGFTKQACIAFSALLMLIYANTNPLLTFDFAGAYNTASILRGTLLLLEQGFYFVGGSVILTSFVAPFCFLTLIIINSLCLLTKRRPFWLATSIHFQQHLALWSMLEVYLLGFIISLVKLLDLAQVNVGVGIWCFAASFLLSSYLVHKISGELYWSTYAKR
ncbi:paraquat-inducible protein A [Alginatibacterium sediminis]|uniref:Paraquat-inducible protein A n=1 Tax=Alginatibacterium sediminis TaxID=2164068 RepID=A0A420EHH4_9ALTE|nr:paraquat-inducible protein A [Alginatibacterium sediminis]RKF20118.1 paraquat-inducible protein A [Alginatibacterium sediminis]